LNSRGERSDSALLDARGKEREGRVFALTLTGGFMFLAVVGVWRSVDLLIAVSLTMAVISLLAALLVPAHLTPVIKAWMKIGEAMGRVTTPILMAMIYYLIVTPLGVMKRTFSPRQSTKVSNWHRRPPLPPPSRLERQF
jgi:hypothetical protein